MLLPLIPTRRWLHPLSVRADVEFYIIFSQKAKTVIYQKSTVFSKQLPDPSALRISTGSQRENSKLNQYLFFSQGMGNLLLFKLSQHTVMNFHPILSELIYNFFSGRSQTSPYAY